MTETHSTEDSHLTEEETAAIEAISNAGQTLIDLIIARGEPTRELINARNRAEEAIMWAIRDITAGE